MLYSGQFRSLVIVETRFENRSMSLTLLNVVCDGYRSDPCSSQFIVLVAVIERTTDCFEIQLRAFRVHFLIYMQDTVSGSGDVEDHAAMGCPGTAFL